MAPPDRGTGRFPADGEPFRPLLFYALAFAVAWAAWAPLILHQSGLAVLPIPFPIALFVCQTLGAFAPLLSLLAMQRITGDPAIVARVFGLLRVRAVPVGWFVLAALAPIAVTAAAAGLAALFRHDAVTLLRPEPLQELGWALAAVIPLQFALGMIGSPLGEEPGWRGYALDGFIRKGRAARGSVVVAGLWFLWHLPLFVVLEVGVDGYTMFRMFGHSLLIDSLFLLSGRNLLVAMLYHQGVNTSFLFFVSDVDAVGGSIVLLLIAAVRVAAHRRHAFSARPSGADGGAGSLPSDSGPRRSA